ncbi:MAG: MurR/RpiR family transcriptional regulator [Sphingomonadales bacterium]
MQNLNDIREQISVAFDSMSANHRRIAVYLLDHPDEVALSSMREIAGRLNIDPSAFVRFAKKLSFSGYSELREVFRDELKSARTGYMERARQIQKKGRQDKIGGLVSDLRLSSEANLDQLFEQNKLELIKAAADDMLKARNIYVVGMRSCFPVAFALHYSCRMIRRRVYLGDGLGGTFADGMRGIGSDDLFVVIGTHPYSRDTVLAADYAAGCGARILALTDSELSPLAAKADYKLIFGHKGPLILGTIVPAIALVEALVAVMIAGGGKEALATLGESDQQLRNMHSYLPATGFDRSRPGRTPGVGD